tara:strand:+ start:2688 stop:2978 length:291 start_codon:yes stop_codon:yes gene_type:complete
MISVPYGARIEVDGKKIGKAPLLYYDRSSLPGRSFQLKATFPNGKIIEKKASVKICPTPANLIMDSLLAGFAFGFCLKDEYIFDLTENSTTPSPKK